MEEKIKEAEENLKDTFQKFGKFSFQTAKRIGILLAFKHIEYGTSLDIKIGDVLEEYNLYEEQKEEKKERKKEKSTKKITIIKGKVGELHIKLNYKKEWDVMIPANAMEELETPEKQYQYLLHNSYGKAHKILKGIRREVVEELKKIQGE